MATSRAQFARTFRVWPLLMFVLAVSLPGAHAQSTFGSIRGTVEDSSGAVVPGATITTHSLDDNSERVTTSNASGEFGFENLKAGNYKVVAHRDGFTDMVISPAVLEARQELRLPITLSVAAEATTVEVTADAGKINTENGTVSNSVSNQDLIELPMNARAVSSSPLAGLALSPSVVTDTQGNISVGGATAAQTGFSVDGISTANVRANGALHDAYPSEEGISETKVTAFNNNAEFAQIGDVTFTTKSGTSQWHGSAFEYFQNDVLDATILSFPSKAPKSFNTFGGSLGGPVEIPRFWNGKAKNTFFFADYEGNRKTTSAPEMELVPTANDRIGDLNDLVAAAGGGPVINPFTGQAYANNLITTAINPVAVALLSYYPLPNVMGPNYYPGAGQTGPQGYNYQTLIPIPSSSNGWDLRVDQQLTSKQQIYARFSWKNVALNEFNDDTVISPAGVFLPSDTASEQNRSLVVSHNYVFSQNLLNEFRLGLTHFAENETFPMTGASAIADLGLNLDNGINLAAHPGGEAFPTFNMLDGSITGIGQGRVGTTISSNYQFTDNLTRVLHTHSLRFGADARRELYNAPMFYAPSDDYGDFNFQGNFTNYSFGDLYLGLPYQSYFAITSPQINAYSWHWGFYAQDEWQVNHHLTVNSGLRYELLPAFQETSGDLASFDPANQSIVVPDRFSPTVAASPLLTEISTGVQESFNVCELPTHDPNLSCTHEVAASSAHLPQGLRFTPKRDFDPRVSIAWRPFNNDRTVVRSGFGLFTATTLGPMSFNNAGVGLSDLLSFQNAVTNGAPRFQFPNTSIPGFVSLGGGSFEEGNDPHFKDPTSAQWNLTVERTLTSNTNVRVSYVGQGTWHLPLTIDLNQIPASTTPFTIPAGAITDPRSPYQNFGMLMYAISAGNANYESGVVEVDHRAGRGLTLMANYTFTRSISDAQGTDAPTAFAGEEPYAVEIANRFNLRYDRGNVVGTPRQRALITGMYDLPYGPGRAWSGGGKLLNRAFGGWSLSTVTLLQTGNWLTPTMNPSFDQSNTNLNNLRYLGGAVARPDCVGNPVPGNRSPSNYFSLDAFGVPPSGAGRFGSCGLGILQGPGEINVNGGFARQVKIHEHETLRMEATFTNVTNHANYAPPAMNINNASTFGVLTSVLPQGSGGNRTGQLALRMEF
jgi:hypothetical protein